MGQKQKRKSIEIYKRKKNCRIESQQKDVQCESKEVEKKKKKEGTDARSESVGESLTALVEKTMDWLLTCGGPLMPRRKPYVPAPRLSGRTNGSKQKKGATEKLETKGKKERENKSARVEFVFLLL